MGISTFNGILGNPADLDKHKHYTGDDYIRFTAHMDIDIYVMYDTRGGTDSYDISHDASWLADEGFTSDIVTPGNPTPTRYFVETTDAVQCYTVYRKSYLEGEEVRLHGNRKGSTDNAIDTNYWVIMKRKDVFESEPASMLCQANPDITPPGNVTNLSAVAGAGTVTLQWQNPDDLDFAGVIIRRSETIPPADVNEGDECTGTVLSPQSYRDESVSAGNTYYYTVFSVDENFNHLEGVSVTAVTAIDFDSDGLSDDYENDDLHIYPFTGGKTDPYDAYTDADGINDGDEVAAGTDPTNPDATIPVITMFYLTSGTPTGNPFITFDCDASDNEAITGWMVTLTNDKPMSGNTNWLGAKPTGYTLPGLGDTYTLYLWTKDAAGNVNDEYTPLTVELTIEKPTITEFGLIGTNLTNNTDICFTANGTDDIGITGWMITGNNTPPSPFEPGWAIDKPGNYILPSTSGDYQLYLWAKDGSDNVSDEYPPISITLDLNIPAVIDFTLTSSAITNNEVVTFTCNGTDDRAITGWMITLESTQPSPSLMTWQAAQPSHYTLPSVGAHYFLYLWIKDQAGNVSSVYTPIDVTLLFQKPVITDFSLMSDPVTQDSLVTFTADGMDDTGITGWMITEESTQPGSGDPGWQGTTPDSYTLPSVDGNYTLYIWAKDAAGNVSDEYPPLNITVDTEIPVVSDFTLTSSTPTNDVIVLFTTDGTDNTGITGWMITESGTQPGSGDPGWLGTEPANHTLPSASGTYTLYVWVKDAAGNVSDSYTPITIDLDAGMPQITGFTLTSISPTNDPVVTFSLDGTDDTGITAWMITQGSTQPLSGDPGWVGVKPTDYTLPSASGTYSLQAWAKDAVGNVSTLHTAMTVELDVEIPVITDFTLINISPTGDPVVTFSLDGTDDIGITGWIITTTASQPGPEDPGWLGTKPGNYTLPSTTEAYTLHTWAKDAGGNVSTLSTPITIETCSITATASGNGSISPAGEVIIQYGRDISFTMTPDQHYHIEDVLVDSVSVGPVSAYEFPQATDNHTIHVVFAIDTYVITATKENHGYIMPEGDIVVNSGGDISFDIIPTSGYWIIDVTVDGISIGPVGNYIFENVTASHTIHAIFPLNLDAESPQITDFTLTSVSPTDNPVVTFTLDGTDNYGITDWMITLDATRPVYSDPGWLGTAPTDYTLPSSTETYTLYVWAKDASFNVSDEYAPITVDLDVENPQILDFSLTSISPTNDPSATFTLDGTDDTGITGWMITTDATQPASGDPGWLGIKPTNYMLPSVTEVYTLYIWAKDAAGNINNVYAPISVDLDVEAPQISGFTLASSSPTDDPVVTFTLSGMDDRGITGWMITDDAAQPASGDPGWVAFPPSDYTLPSATGTYTLYAWAKDAVGNVSDPYTPITVDIDVGIPQITDFTLTSTSPTGDIVVTFTLYGTDDTGITGWMITTDAAQPLQGDPEWLTSPPSDYTLPSATGTYTLYAWAKDAVGHVSDQQTPITIELDVGIPNITDFTLTSSSPTSDPVVTFDLDGTDNIAITSWMITEDNNQPAATDAGWLALKPQDYQLTSDGTNELYAWAKDAAGNVSNVCGSIYIELELVFEIYNIPAGGSGYEEGFWNAFIFDSRLLFVDSKNIPYEFDGSVITKIAIDVSSDYSSGLYYCIEYNSKLYFMGYDSENIQTMYVYDGETINSVQSSAPQYDHGFTNQTIFEGILYFYGLNTAGDYKIYKYDGVTVQDVPVSSSSDYAYHFDNDIIYGSRLYFQGEDSLNTGKLYFIENSEIHNIVDAPSEYDREFFSPTLFNDAIYFIGMATSGTRKHFKLEGNAVYNLLYCPDYTAAESSWLSKYFIFDSKIYFLASDGTNWKVYCCDGNEIQNVDPGSSGYVRGFSNPVIFDSKLYFQGNDGTNNKIYYYDGVEIQNVNPGSSGYHYDFASPIIFDSKLYFQGSDGTTYQIPPNRTRNYQFVYYVENNEINNVSSGSSDYLNWFTNPLIHNNVVFFSGAFHEENGSFDYSIYELRNNEVGNISVGTSDYLSRISNVVSYNNNLYFEGIDEIYGLRKIYGIRIVE